MSQKLTDLLERLDVPKESVAAMEFKPGASYLIVGNDRFVPSQVKEDLVEGLFKTFGIHVAVIWVFGDPDKVISAFKIKD